MTGLISNQQLTDLVCQLSQAKFHRAFEHQAFWNGRLRSTGGRFFPKDLHLDFNPKMYGRPEFEGIVLHELTHYHLYRLKRGYKHGDADFKRLLAQVGGSRFAPALPENQPKRVYICQTCGQVYFRTRKLDTRKYRCGRCRGRLQEQK